MKKILVTGSTDGIGKLVAIKLAKDGHQIYLHGRNQEKLTKAIEEAKLDSGNENVSGFVADFSDLSAVKSMSDEVKNDLESLDILINNAGVYNSSVPQNEDELDTRFVVNYLASYLLTKELLTVLRHGNDARVINLASAAQAPVDLEVLMGRRKASEPDTYAQSKLALIMWSFQLAENEKDLNVIAVNPGSLLHTKMALEAFGSFWSPAEKGADILYALAISEKYKSVSGKYFNNDSGNFAQAHPDAYDNLKIGKLMKVTNEILER